MNNFAATIDWDATGSMLQAWGTIGGALAVVVVARMGFNVWKRQKQAEAKKDEAKAILSASYHARRALNRIRSGAMHGWEHNKAIIDLDETEPEWGIGLPDKMKQRIITHKVFLNRLSTTTEQQAALEDCLPMAKELFSKECEEAVNTLLKQFRIISICAQCNIDDWDGTDEKWTNYIRLTLYRPQKEGKIDPDDEVSIATDESIEIIERICSPALRLENV